MRGRERQRVARRVRMVVGAHSGPTRGPAEIGGRWPDDGAGSSEGTEVSAPEPGPPEARRPPIGRLPGRLRVRLDPGRRGATAMGVAVAVAALVAGLWLYLARPHSEAVAVVPAAPTETSSPASSAGPSSLASGSGATSGSGGAGSSAAGPSGVPSSSAAVVVDVVGKVRRPGVYPLPAGDRVTDALAAAGGALPGVDTASLNLARKLVDGEQIAVGVTGATEGPAATAAANPTAASGGGPVDLNTATLEQLDALPGVGPVLAQRILDWRTQHGSFASVDQLREVSGIGPAKFADLQPLVTI